MNPRRARVETSKRYELVAAALRVNIAAGRLPPGLVLLEGSIAGLLKTSRAPVQTALRILEEEDLVRRFEGRGYLVGGAKSTEKPLRTDLTKFGLSVSDEIDSALQNRGLWERVYEEVETAVAASLVFGDFRIIESELGDYYGVSRTVVRDVLSRLHERGLIAKTASSHWVVNALTAQSVRERFKLREILEPEALRLAADTMEYDMIGEALRRERERDPRVKDPSAWDRLDKALMTYGLARSPNGHLVELIEQNRLPLTAAFRALTKLGLPDDAAATGEYLVLFELIAGRAIDAAATYWRGHLATLAGKNLARLKIVAVFPDPPVDVPYLTPRDA